MELWFDKIKYLATEHLKAGIRDGVLYLHRLQKTELPPLPEGIVELVCTNTNLVEIPPLPVGLELFDCGGNSKLSSLPPLPIGLKILQCGKCDNLTSLPELPSSLKVLSCWNTGITQLPTLPETIEELYCSYIQLTNLLELPKGLKKLSIENLIPIPHCYYYITYDDITKDLPQIPPATLPNLPVGLKSLCCVGINLIELPPLPPNLNVLECAYNPLTKLPRLPRGLERLNCSCTKIKELPPLPSGLSLLWVRQTLLTELPELPDNLELTPVSVSHCPYLPIIECISGEGCEGYKKRWLQLQREQSKKRIHERTQAIKEELISIQSSREHFPFDNHLTV